MHLLFDQFNGIVFLLDHNLSFLSYVSHIQLSDGINAWILTVIT